MGFIDHKKGQESKPEEMNTRANEQELRQAMAAFAQRFSSGNYSTENHAAENYAGANYSAENYAGANYATANYAGANYSTANYSAESAAAAQDGYSDDDELKYTLDDMGNARRLVDMFGAGIRYCFIDKEWLCYNGLRWCPDNDGTIDRYIDAAVDSMDGEFAVYAQTHGDRSDEAKNFKKHIRSSRSHRGREAAKKVACHHVPVLPNELDRYKMALNTPSGMVNLQNGELSESKPEYFFTKLTAAPYVKDAPCPQWEKFLGEIFGGDKDLIRYVQKAVGYSLTGSTAEECAFFLYGTGRNGKSTFLDIVRCALGDYAANIQPETIMVRNMAGNHINSDIARLKGARFVTSVEPNEGLRLNEGLLKQLTGEDMVTARKLFCSEFEFIPEFKLWLTTNHKPVIRGTDEGIWRRVHLIPFTVQIPIEKVDKDLRTKLRSELPGILRWCIDGGIMWQKEGLTMPRAVIDSVKEYRREMDVVSAFIEDKCELSGAIQSSTLYAAYSDWAEINNEFRLSATKFSMELKKRGFEKMKAHGIVYFNGISL